MHPDDRAFARSEHIKMLTDGGPYRGRYRIKTKQGDYVLVRDDGYAYDKDGTTNLFTKMSGIISRVDTSK
jgi:hypothetical protein